MSLGVTSIEMQWGAGGDQGVQIGLPKQSLNLLNFCRLYGMLAGEKLVTERLSNSSTPLPGSLAEGKARAKNLLDILQVPKECYAIGKTCLFFKAGQLSKLDEARDHKLVTSSSRPFKQHVELHWQDCMLTNEAQRLEASKRIQEMIKERLIQGQSNWRRLFQACETVVECDEDGEEDQGTD